MRSIFLDTVGLLALWDEADQWHTAAMQAMNELTGKGVRFVTSMLVMLECGNAAARAPYRRHVAEFRQELANFGNLLVPSTADEQAAWDVFAKGEAGDAGIVDCVSFILMGQLNILEAFTNDKHFTAAGFRVLF